MKVVVSGMIATYPVGGVVWDYAQYLLGLMQMGCEVYYLEDTGWETYHPGKGCYGSDCSYGVAYLKESLQSLAPELADRWHFLSMDGDAYGIPRERFLSIMAEADLFLNVSGSCLLREEYMSCRRKVLMDTDPGWNHFVNYPKWDNHPGWQGARSYRDHDMFLTYAENIGQRDCLLPDLGLDWKTTRPLVVMDRWQAEDPAEHWTTVMTWKNFKQSIEYQGRTYGTKEIEFERIKELPGLVPVKLEMAVGGNEAPRGQWQKLGWSVIDSHGVSGTPEDYRHYIQSSRGEFSVAKNVYVATRSGWFSCRTVCYLAAGRPAVIQDTGFSRFIPTGEGVLVFNNLEEARAAIVAVEDDYRRHQTAAREMAKKYFSAEVVLTDMFEKVGLATGISHE